MVLEHFELKLIKVRNPLCTHIFLFSNIQVLKTLSFAFLNYTVLYLRVIFISQAANLPMEKPKNPVWLGCAFCQLLVGLFSGVLPFSLCLLIVVVSYRAWPHCTHGVLVVLPTASSLDNFSCPVCKYCLLPSCFQSVSVPLLSWGLRSGVFCLLAKSPEEVSNLAYPWHNLLSSLKTKLLFSTLFHERDYSLPSCAGWKPQSW